jgi:hypothetical protein
VVATNAHAATDIASGGGGTALVLGTNPESFKNREFREFDDPTAFSRL